MLGFVSVVDSGVAGSDVVGVDVACVDVVGADVDWKIPPEQRSSPFSLIEVKAGSWSPEKLSWKPNSAKSPSFPEKWDGLSREKVCPEPESVPCQKVRESRGKSVVRLRLKLLELDSALPVASPATPVDYQGLAGSCRMTNIINVEFC